MRKGNALYNAALGIAGLVVATLALTVSAALLIMPRQAVDLKVIQAEKVSACEATAQREGFMVTNNSGQLTLRDGGVDGFKEKLLTSSLVMAQCQGFVMTAYCMGSCADDNNATFEGVIMKLEYREPNLK